MTPGSYRITRWEVYVEPDWRGADADLAVMVAVFRPGNVRLVDVWVGPGLWFERGVRADDRREVTPQRLAASRRALRRQRERVPLFADHVAAEQPTPEQRIEQIDAGVAQRWRSLRLGRARHWRALRRELAAMPPAQRASVLEHWNRRTHPGNPEMLQFVMRKVGMTEVSGIDPEAI